MRNSLKKLVGAAGFENSALPIEQTLDTHALPFDFRRLTASSQKFNKFNFHRFFQSISKESTRILPDHSPENWEKVKAFFRHNLKPVCVGKASHYSVITLCQIVMESVIIFTE